MSRMPALRAAALILLATFGPHAVAAMPQSDRIVVEKSAHRLTLYSHGAAIHSYQVALGSGGTGPKQRQGDNLTPEGVYVIDARNAASAFHRSLHLSYPNAHDQTVAVQLGVDPGGDIMIHGLRNGIGWIGLLHRTVDWTRGCIAVTDQEMDQIWDAAPIGTPVEIQP